MHVRPGGYSGGAGERDRFPPDDPLADLDRRFLVVRICRAESSPVFDDHDDAAVLVQPAKLTIPSAVATTLLPGGTEMSTPVWNRGSLCTGWRRFP